jgi:hypothetical protein
VFFPFRGLLKLPKFSELRNRESSVGRGFPYIANDIQRARGGEGGRADRDG